MPQVEYQGTSYEMAPGESVLECLLRHEQPVTNSCRAGVCQSCLLRASKGIVPDAATKMLKPSLAEQGLFLACMCHPKGDLVVKDPGKALRFRTRIVAVVPLSATVALVQLETPESFTFWPGQYITLIRDDGLARSYSISSGSGEGVLNLHVRRIPGGRFSEWLHTGVRPDTVLQIQGPAGECFYSGIPTDQPILLAGSGTGLAPLFGILQDAIAKGHRGPIWLYHGALEPSGLYLREMLATVAAENENVHYIPLALQAGPSAEFRSAGEATPPRGELRIGRLEKVILEEHTNFKDFRVFVCGDADVVNTLRKALFLAGVPSKEIYADPFIASPVDA